MFVYYSTSSEIWMEEMDDYFRFLCCQVKHTFLLVYGTAKN